MWPFFVIDMFDRQYFPSLEAKLTEDSNQLTELKNWITDQIKSIDE